MAGSAGTTRIGTDDALAIKLQSNGLLREQGRKMPFLRMMMGSAQAVTRNSMGKTHLMSSPGYPIVKITDLSEGPGDEVSVDLVHEGRGLPVMGDAIAQGSGEKLTFATQKVKLNLTRKVYDIGGYMTQQRTRWDLPKLAYGQMGGYFGVLNQERVLISMAGARGSVQQADWIVPLETHPRFAEIMINPILPPTSNRRFIVGGHSSIANITTDDVLTLPFLTTVQTKMREMPFPPPPVEVANDEMGNYMPLWCLFVTDRVWHYLQQAAGEQSWNKYIAAASTRALHTRHPLFLGNTGIWDGLMIKRYPKAIRFYANSSVKESSTTVKSDGTGPATTTATVPAAVSAVDRCILVGGQALYYVEGNPQKGVGPGEAAMTMKLLTDDGGFRKSLMGAQVGAFAKSRFVLSDGVWTDFATTTIDSYAPDPMSQAGRDLTKTLSGK